LDPPGSVNVSFAIHKLLKSPPPATFNPFIGFRLLILFFNNSSPTTFTSAPVSIVARMLCPWSTTGILGARQVIGDSVVGLAQNFGLGICLQIHLGWSMCCLAAVLPLIVLELEELQLLEDAQGLP